MKKSSSTLTSLLAVLLSVTGLTAAAAAVLLMSVLYLETQKTSFTFDTLNGSIQQARIQLQDTSTCYLSLDEETAARNQQLKTEIQELKTTIQEQKAAPESAPDAASDTSYIVAIDPGHQGWNVDMSDLEPMGPGSSEMKAKASTGTSGTYSGLPEFELNLTIAKKLRDILTERGYRIVLTREDNDTAISNSERAQLATEQNADIYVRIHANGEDSHTLSGALTMVPSPSNPYVGYLAEDSYRLGECLLNSYCAATGFSNMGVQYYDNMTGINWSTVPVTIIEMGFMTHEYDDLKMADPQFQDIMAAGIADGIDTYFDQDSENP